MTQNSSRPSVVLVHGAFADASGYAGVMRELLAAGVSVSAPPVPLRGLAFDADAIGAHVRAIEGPVVLVGHSYGGAVITQASATLENVVGLVYMAAFALDVGESVDSAQKRFAPSLLEASGRATPYDARGAAGGPDLFVDPKSFRETFCADLPGDLAAVMSFSQRPLSAAALAEECTATGWRTTRTSYLVAENDHTINPDAQRFMAERTGGTVGTINGSHVSFISRPVESAAFILGALA